MFCLTHYLNTIKTVLTKHLNNPYQCINYQPVTRGCESGPKYNRGGILLIIVLYWFLEAEVPFSYSIWDPFRYFSQNFDFFLDEKSSGLIKHYN